MDIPVIETPVFPRWVWIEEITYSHIPIATLITAFMLLAPLFEYIGYRRKDPRLERLSKGMIWFVMILFSPGAALGTGIPVFLIGTYPEFWHRWSNIFFWPLIIQFCFFMIEVGFLFFAYYLTWDLWQKRHKILHIWMGVFAAFFGYMVQIVWDALGSYMTTPGAPLPAVDDPVGWSAAAFFNPSFPMLLLHRTFGNFSYVMLLVGGVYAIKYMNRMNATDPKRIEDRDYYRWGADFMFTIGLLTFFAQPIIGWFYAKVIQNHAPAAFAAIMGGHKGYIFTIKMALILIFLTIGATYLSVRHKSRWVPIALSAGLLSLLGIIHIHPPLYWVGGSETAWYAVSMLVPVALVALVWLVRGRFTGDRKPWRWAMLVAGIAAFFTFALGGYTREASRNPDTVYGEIVKPEATQLEQDRWLMYRTCLTDCHGQSPTFLERTADRDWSKVVPRELARPNTPNVTEDEARRIEKFLREHYP